MAGLEDISLAVAAALAGIFVLGGIVKGALGFGLPLVTMAILPLLIPVETALLINAVNMVLTNLIQFLQFGRARETVARHSPLLLGLILGVPPGVFLVAKVSEAGLLVVLGVFVVTFSLINLWTPKLMVPPRFERPLGAAVGFIGGIVGAMTTANGPIFVSYMLGLRVERAHFLSALSLFFLLTGLLVAGGFWVAGMFDLPRVVLGLMMFPAAWLGMYLGNLVIGWLPADKFRLLVLGVLCVLGVNLLRQGFGG